MAAAKIKKDMKMCKKKVMDETGVEPVTFCLQGRRATNYATRPNWKINIGSSICRFCVLLTSFFTLVNLLRVLNTILTISMLRCLLLHDRVTFSSVTISLSRVDCLQ